MSTDNPVSPKVIAGGIGAALLPIFIYLLQIVAENLHLIEGLPGWAYGAAAVIGSVIGSYAKADPLRLPTIDQDAVDNLNTEEA